MNKPGYFRNDSSLTSNHLFWMVFYVSKKGNKMVGYNYREHWGAEKTPLGIAVSKFFVNNPNYKLTTGEFASLVSVLLKYVLENA